MGGADGESSAKSSSWCLKENEFLLFNDVWMKEMNHLKANMCKSSLSNISKANNFELGQVLKKNNLSWIAKQGKAISQIQIELL